MGIRSGELHVIKIIIIVLVKRFSNVLRSEISKRNSL